jgi:chromosomal replication initiation ATPase DnaA
MHPYLFAGMTEQGRRGYVLHNIYGAPNPGASVDNICARMGVTKEELLSRRKSRRLQLIRQILFLHLRIHFKMTYKAIGELMHRDHSSVVFSVRVIQNYLAQEQQAIDLYVEMMGHKPDEKIYTLED